MAHQVGLVSFLLFLFAANAASVAAQDRQTVVRIVGEQFYINETPTYEGRTWTSGVEGFRIEGLLMNARLVQGIFDDLNPATQGQWAYPDTRRWDPARNTEEFVQAMASWREHGLLSFTINLQGGCPYGYCRSQPWENSAFDPEGSLRPDFMDRLKQIIDRADELGMVVILGYFYFGQDDRLQDEAAVLRAVDNATNWVLSRGYTNVIIEINNECNINYDHAILQCGRVHELIERVKAIEVDGRSLYASTSLGGGSVPPPNIVAASDFVLLHGNGVSDPDRMADMIAEVRQMEGYTAMPIVNNEDDQPWRVEEQGWGEEGNNFVAAARNYASWGYFDFRLEREHLDYNQGFQSVPVNWQITSERKRDFFELLARITGSPGTPRVNLSWPGEIGAVRVEFVGLSGDVAIERVELLINNEVAAGVTDAPNEFRLEQVPTSNHWVRARVRYQKGGNEVVIESPYYENPWWPYGGPTEPADGPE